MVRRAEKAETSRFTQNKPFTGSTAFILFYGEQPNLATSVFFGASSILSPGEDDFPIILLKKDESRFDIVYGVI